MKTLTSIVCIAWLVQFVVAEDRCACEFQPIAGQVQDCCCDFQTVEQINSDIRPTLQELLHTPFFNYLKVNVHKACPFWPDNVMCFRQECSVEECPENEIPDSWKSQTSDLNELTFAVHGLPTFQKCEFSEQDFCIHDPDDDPNAVYVKLSDNPESFTGYDGESASRVWRAIYTENCFTTSVEETCSEKRIFFRIISGLHTSIGANVAAQYYNSTTNHWEFNLPMFEAKVANFPDRLNNLYFTYLMVLRAVGRLSNYLEHYEFSVGDNALDARTYELLNQLTTYTMNCPPTFDETSLFKDEMGEIVKEEFKEKFRNISRIMDCVVCEKCRLWGKLEVLGLGTALKVLYSYDMTRGPIDYQLQRSEINALFNVLGKLSDSLQAYYEYTQLKLHYGESAEEVARTRSR